MEILHTILHWAGTILWYVIRGSILIAVLAIAAFTAVGWFALILGPIIAPLFKERSSFKKAKGKSKGPINPYTNQSQPTPDKTTDRA